MKKIENKPGISMRDSVTMLGMTAAGYERMTDPLFFLLNKEMPGWKGPFYWFNQILLL